MWFVVSGGHINPAVTFGLLLARKLSLTRAIFYIVMQCLGAICGAGVVKGFEGSQSYEVLGGGANVVNSGYTKGDGLGAEIVGTFVLVYTVFSATDAKRNARDSHVPVCILLFLSQLHEIILVSYYDFAFLESYLFIFFCHDFWVLDSWGWVVSFFTILASGFSWYLCLICLWRLDCLVSLLDLVSVDCYLLSTSLYLVMWFIKKLDSS